MTSGSTKGTSTSAGTTGGALYNIAAPEAFNFSHPEEWEKWKRRFERYRLASKLINSSEEEQVNTLLYLMGDKADDVLTMFQLSERESLSYTTIIIKRKTGETTVWAGYVDPVGDKAFKYVFGDENHKEVTIGFINDIFKRARMSQVKDIQFQRPEVIPKVDTRKLHVIDILCTFDNGSRVFIEMQCGHLGDFKKRSTYYACDAYTGQLRHKGDYYDLKPVVFIGIIDGGYLFDDPYVPEFSVHTIRCNNRHTLKDITWIYIELSKFERKQHQPTNVITQWAYYFKYADITNIEEFHRKVKDNTVKEAFNALHRYGNTPEAEEDEAERRRTESLKEKELYESKMEGKMEMAKRLFEEGISAELIARIANLTIDEVNNL